MQELTSKEQEQKPILTINDLTIEEKDRLVGAFVWLIKEDKKQNPALYQVKNRKND